MSFELKAKKEEYAKIVTQLQDLASTVGSEKRAFTTDEKEKANQLQTEERSLKEEIETLKTLQGVNNLSQVDEEIRNVQPVDTRRRASKKDEDLAFRGWLLDRSGNPGDLTDEHRSAAIRANRNFNSRTYEVRQQQTAVDSEGGHLVPSFELGSVVEQMKSFGGMRAVSTVIPRSKNTGIKHPVIDDTNNRAGRRSELAATADTPIVVSSVDLSGVEFSSGIFPLSVELARDSAVNIQQLASSILSKRLSKAVNEEATSNATFVGVTNDAEVVATIDFGALSYANLVAIQNSVDESYQASARFMFSRNTFANVQLMVDANGRPLWRPDLVGGNAGTILGKPYTINEDCDSILYGDFSYYHLVEVGNPELFVANELYRISHNAIGLALFGCYGGKLVDSNAIKQFTDVA